MITWGAKYWPYFLIGVTLAFSGPELFALFTNPANTLSIYSQTMLGIYPKFNIHHLAWWLSLTGWLLFVLVITQHIWFEHIWIP